MCPGPVDSFFHCGRRRYAGNNNLSWLVQDCQPLHLHYKTRSAQHPNCGYRAEGSPWLIGELVVFPVP